MSLASIQRIVSVAHHPNADLLDVVQCLGYKAIVKRDQWKVGDLCVLIEPDSVLPDKPWAAFYRAKSSRVKAIKLRGVFSFGIVESLENLGVPDWYDGPIDHKPGDDLTEFLEITKYETPAPQDLAASGPYGFGIPRTDESRWQSLDDLPYGQKVDVSVKLDGQSWSALCHLNHVSPGVLDATRAIGGRSFLYKLDSDNAYTRNERAYGVLDKLEAFCRRHETSLCLRGEQYGHGIQKGAHNPHSKLPLGLALFSTWLIDERRYARKGDRFYIFDIAAELGLPTVPIIERDVELTPALIRRYSEELETINGQPFEGVVVNHANGSFKIISLAYDTRH